MIANGWFLSLTLRYYCEVVTGISNGVSSKLSCRVVGIAGGQDKCRFVKEELGFDACLNHREPELDKRLKATCPDGIDIYFETVGGAVFDAVLPLFNPFARIPACGLIAHYNDKELPPEPNRVPLLMRAILAKRLTFSGFIYFDYASQFSEFIRETPGR